MTITRVVARLADTEGQVSGTAAHRRHDEPVAAGAGIDIDGPGDHRTLVFGRFVAEGRRAVGQRKVVVDGFRDMYVGDRMTLFFQKFGHAVGRRCRVVAADGHQQLDVVLGEELPVETLLEIFVRRFEAAHAQERTREVENFVRFEEGDVLRGGRFAEEPCEPLWSPMTLYPFCRKVFATLPTTVFMPGAGPPPVRMAIASFRLVISYLIL